MKAILETPENLADVEKCRIWLRDRDWASPTLLWTEALGRSTQSYDRHAQQYMGIMLAHYLGWYKAGTRIHHEGGRHWVYKRSTTHFDDLLG